MSVFATIEGLYEILTDEERSAVEGDTF